MISKPIDQVMKEDIDALLTNAVPEGRTIDYKLTLSGGGNADKKEFLADVCSFANAAGGDLLFGITENQGVPTSIPGLLEIDADATILRLENLIRDSIDPRIPGVHMKAINGFEKGPVLLIRIPKSWASPHMVTFKNTSRFYTRNSAGKYQMDVTEIRSAFALSDELPKKVEAFRNDRLAKIIAGETPVPTLDNPKLILHVIPFSAMSLYQGIAPSDLYQQHMSLRPFRSLGFNSQINFDGLVTYTSSTGGGYTGYCQGFRSGAIEAVDAYTIRENEELKAVPTTTLVQSLDESVQQYLNALVALETPEPAVLQLTIVGARGYKLAVGQNWDWQSQPAIDRDMLILPDVLVENFDCDVHALIKPILDGLWNACGYHWCNWYDEDGNWTPQR